MFPAIRQQMDDAPSKVHGRHRGVGKDLRGSKIRRASKPSCGPAGFPEVDVGQAVAFARKRMELIRGTGPYSELETRKMQ